MVTHSSILVWRIQWTDEPWWAIVHGVAKSQTRLKRLSTHWKLFFFFFFAQEALKRPVPGPTLYCLNHNLH